MSTAAEAVLARSGRTFHLASRLLPAQMRSDAAELYSYCRAVDDLADEGAEEGQIAIMEAIRALEADPLGEEAASFGWPVELEAHFPRISRVAVKLTQALAADAGPRRMTTEAALLEYAFGVAGTVGIMMCRILGAPPEAAKSAADLGIAMQLTNIARDVREDWERDRIYLPAEWVAPAEVAAALNGGEPGPLIAATERLLALAERYYASGDTGMRYLPRRARIGILSAAACYREIGIVVTRNIPLSWRRRAVVSSARKAALVARSFTRMLPLHRPQEVAPSAVLGREP